MNREVFHRHRWEQHGSFMEKNHSHLWRPQILAMAYIVPLECGPDQSIPHGTHELRLRGCGFLGLPRTFRHHEWDRGRWHHRAAEAQEQEQIDFY